MNINGHEIAFDMDNRKDYARFVKAFAFLTKKQERAPINDEDMESFLTGCLKQDQVNELLQDGRISTLTKVFVEFFSNAIDQHSEVSRVYADDADTLAGMKGRTEALISEYDEINKKASSASNKKE